MKYIESNVHKIVGVGHMFHNWMLGYIISKKLNIDFVYSSLNATVRNPKTLNETWDEFLGFQKNIKEIHSFSNHIELPFIENNTFFLNPSKNKFDLKFQEWYDIIDNYEDNTLFKLPPGSFVNVFDIEIYNNIEKLYQSYWKNKSKFNFKNDKINAVIHIRRGDINLDEHSFRWISFDELLEKREYLRKEHKNIHFTILSETGYKHAQLNTENTSTGHYKKNSFDIFKDSDTTLILNYCDLQCFHMMCSADILITAPSAFSIFASYLNKTKEQYHLINKKCGESRPAVL